MKLYDLQIALGHEEIDKSRHFNFRYQFLSALILKTVASFETGPIRKIHIDLGCAPRMAEARLNVIVTRRPFDLSAYSQASHKRKFVFDAVRDELLLLSQEFQWDTELLASRLASLENTRFDHIFTLRKSPKVSPDRRRVASLKAYWDEEGLKIAVHVLSRRTSEESEIEVFVLPSDEPFPRPLISGLSWVGNDRVRLLYGRNTPSQETVFIGN